MNTSMEIKVFNSLTNSEEILHPIKPGEISMYCCGPTVYGDAHVGNIRPVIVFDTFRRFLEKVGYDVKLVSNFTDVDDKIINKAQQEGVPEQVISERYIAAYKEVLKSLNVKPHYQNPKVTEYMPEIIKYIDELVKKGAAYEVDGDVFFRISSIKNYGELQNINVDDLVVGARIEENSKKESPLDFVLWKKTNVGIQWDSPWGKGRPGWHTECCVMINSIFGGMIDIHGGGFDLKFPHHENEIAQAKAHDGHRIANVWMHNGFVNFGNEKMSKSLGNVILAKDALKEFGPNLLRLLILSTHYRAPVQFTEETVSSAKNELAKISQTYKQLAVALQVANLDLKNAKGNIDKFLTALSEDFNTSNGFTCLYEELKNANVELRKNPKDNQKLLVLFANIRDILDVFGLDIKYPVLSDEDKATYAKYLALKTEKKFDESDALRKVLIEKGIL